MANENMDTGEASADLLVANHRELDRRLDQLVNRARKGEPTKLRDEWRAFSSILARHLDLEEAEIVPGFEREDLRGAQAIVAEHDQIRRDLSQLGSDLLNADMVESFARRLKSHAQWEEKALYAWAGKNVTHGTWRSIKRGLRDAMEGWRYSEQLCEPNLWQGSRPKH